MGVAGSDKNSGSEHPGRSSGYFSSTDNSLDMGAVPLISIDALHRSPYGCNRLKIDCSGRYCRATIELKSKVDLIANLQRKNERSVRT